MCAVLGNAMDQSFLAVVVLVDFAVQHLQQQQHAQGQLLENNFGDLVHLTFQCSAYLVGQIVNSCQLQQKLQRMMETAVQVELWPNLPINVWAVLLVAHVQLILLAGSNQIVVHLALQAMQ